MSFETRMKPKLNPKLDANNQIANDWYVRATMEAMNEYMQDLEKILRQECCNVRGTATFIVPGSPPYPMTVSVGQKRSAFVPATLRFSFNEVKTAMWCGQFDLCFINLFNLFGNKLANNFRMLKVSPYMAGVVAPATWQTMHWGALGIALVNYARALGKFCTPEKFLAKQSELIENGIKTTFSAPCAVSATVPVGTITMLASGGPASVPPQVMPLPGVFVGCVEASFDAV